MTAYNRSTFCKDCERRRNNYCLEYKGHAILSQLVCEWVEEFNPDDYKFITGNVKKGASKVTNGRGIINTRASIEF